MVYYRQEITLDKGSVFGGDKALGAELFDSSSRRIATEGAGARVDALGKGWRRV